MIETIVVIVLLIAALLAYTATKPATFRIERTAQIHAPADRIFPHINEFERWKNWSPWEPMDPTMKRTLSGPAAGRGAVYEWEGNNQVGQGRMEILESAPSSRILIQLDFFKPFEAHNQAEFILRTIEGDTTVTWAMSGPHPFMMRVMSLVMNMDKMVGKNFETGLANLKALTEQ